MARAACRHCGIERARGQLLSAEHGGTLTSAAGGDYRRRSEATGTGKASASEAKAATVKAVVAAVRAR
eukprot:1145868-Prymnesium_polylepis.1